MVSAMSGRCVPLGYSLCLRYRHTGSFEYTETLLKIKVVNVYVRCLDNLIINFRCVLLRLKSSILFVLVCLDDAQSNT